MTGFRLRDHALARALALVWRSAPGWTVASVCLVLVQGGLPAAGLVVLRRLIDGVTEGAAGRQPDAFGRVVPWILLGAGIALATVLCRALAELVAEGQGQTVADAVTSTLHTHSVAADLAYYEDPHYRDSLHRAQREAPFRPTRIVGGLVQIGQNALSAAGVAALLLTLHPRVGVLLAVAAGPGIYLRMVFARRLGAEERRRAPQERRAAYYSRLLTESAYAKEIRLFGLGLTLGNRFRALRHELRDARLSLLRRKASADAVAQILAVAAVFGAFAFIAREAVVGAVTVGGLVMCYQGFFGMLGFLQGAAQAVGRLVEDSLFLSDYFTFIDLKPTVRAPDFPTLVPGPERRVLTFENVSFTYPGAPRPALHGIDLALAPGEVIAVVGHNGSGKTTLLKLLSRLYDPTSGRIACGGVDLRELDPVAWRRELSMVFQDFARYQLTARENIWLGDVALSPRDGRIIEAARQAGAKELLEGLPSGYDTILGHSFWKGQELSVGEWQKVALARAFARDAFWFVLDEPTSALDPVAEEELFRQFRSVVKGKSAILVSHRFSTVRMADCIYVLDDGSVKERGSHEELLRQGGLYAHLYRAQAEHFTAGRTDG